MKLSRSTPDAGFTLLELLASLAIAAVALVVTIPALTGSRSDRAIKTTTSAIIAKIDQTRSRAMTSGRPASFSIDPDSRGYRADDGDIVALPVGMTFSTASGPQHIVFRPDGTATPADFGLQHGRVKAHLGIDWLTGRASVAFER
jgi:prepilin-type N-terminal cleavage/methylation domain-containing protein